MKKAFVMALFAIGIMGKSEVYANTHEYLVADTLSSEAFSKQLDAVSIEIKKAQVEVEKADVMIFIGAPSNIKNLANADNEKLAKRLDGVL